jgi:multiple sugar transport system substrate-binding protein
MLSVFSLTLLLALLIGASAAGAQSNVVLTLAVPQMNRMSMETDTGLLEAFEAENPGVNVVIEYVENFSASPVSDIDAYLEDVQAFVEQGDVVYVDSNSIAPEATRAGLFLNLAPLTNGDPSLNVNDFYPTVWQSFQWDQGVWALPASTNAVGLSYDPVAFDAAGLAYPSAGWTIDDLANAARALTVRDSSGAVSIAGLSISPNDVPLIFRSLLGQPFYDASTLPTNPRLATPELEALLNTWQALVEEGVVTMSGGSPGGEPPMGIGFGRIAIYADGDNGELVSETAYALLPGGGAGLNTSGFAVSAGTQYPEQAYALARYLTTRPEVASGFGLSSPARQSLVGSPVVLGGGESPMVNVRTPEAMTAFVSEALANGLPYSETRFSNYLSAAVAALSGGGVDALTALQTVEADAVVHLQAADAARGQVAVAVATPVPTPVLQAGEIVLNFGVSQGNLIVANKDAWNQAIATFVAADPQVGQVILDSPSPIGGMDPAYMLSNYDCFYEASNLVPDLDLSLVRNLDPFIDTDPSFDRSDIIGNTLVQLQRDNRTWAYPMMIQPVVMQYDRDQFAAAGVPEPTNGWTVDAFVDALTQLKAAGGEGAPLTLGWFSNTNLLMLVAAFGGLPYDYRTTPETLNLTDPATVNAIQQVLDLAKNGLVAYTEMGAMTGNPTTVTAEAENPAITVQTLGSMGGVFAGGMGMAISMSAMNPDTDANTALTTFPSGSQYNALAYNIGAAYISATTQNPDACYRLISALAQQPHLFGSMPARRSLINSQQVLASEGADAVTAFNHIDSLMQDPNTIIFPTFQGSGTPATFLTQIWLNQAFDGYVIRDEDLALEMADAETKITAFNECVAALPPFDWNTPGAFEGYTNCAVQIDPELSAMFGG